jgi:hypothetical protein
MRMGTRLLVGVSLVASASLAPVTMQGAVPARAADTPTVPTQSRITLDSGVICDTDGNGLLDTPTPALTDGDPTTEFSRSADRLTCAVETPQTLTIQKYTVAFGKDTKCGLGSLTVDTYGYNGDPTQWTPTNSTVIGGRTSADAAIAAADVGTVNDSDGTYTWIVYDVNYVHSHLVPSPPSTWLVVRNVAPRGQRPFHSARSVQCGRGGRPTVDGGVGRE